MVPDTRQRLAAVVADTRKLLVRKSWLLSLFSFHFFLFSLERLVSLLLPLTLFQHTNKSLQDESDLSETPEEDVKAVREAAEAAEAALAKADADGE